MATLLSGRLGKQHNASSQSGLSGSTAATGELTVKLKVRRYNAGSAFAERPYWQTYTISASPIDRVLDVLLRIKDEQDGSLTFRRSCGHGICGSDAIRINGQNRLACQVLLRNVVRARKPIVIEPIKGLPVIRDLVVDMEPFYQQYRTVLPFLITDNPREQQLAQFGGSPVAQIGDREQLQSPAQQARFQDTTKCILCAACTTSCPVYWSTPEYLGPAALVAAHRFIFDSRDHGGAERLDIIDSPEGVWRCRTAYNCTAACPRDIAVTAAIAELKHAELAQGL